MIQFDDHIVQMGLNHQPVIYINILTFDFQDLLKFAAWHCHLVGGFKYVLFSSLPGEDSQFD